jgi:carbonic anhydrase
MESTDARQEPVELRTRLVAAHEERYIPVIREMFQEYADWLAIDLWFQNFEQELASLPGAYGPPRGRLYLALAGGHPAGCVGLREYDEERAELKRLWVRDSFKGNGIGRLLVRRIVEDAREIGYHHILLDTLPKMEEALRLYESFGFRETWPYTNNPQPGVLFLSLEL